MTERMAAYLRDFARHVRSDQASTDEFMVESMTFPECLELMDHVAAAVDEYVRQRGPSSSSSSAS